MDYEEKYLRLALKLAAKGKGMVSPNPIVGAVIVKNGVIVGSSWHEKAGGPHAEINAIAAAGEKAKGAELYVTLEPCCHQGKTPPCTEAIKKAGIKRVYAAVKDPNPLVAGKGIAALNSAGITASCGYLQKEAESQNEAFIKYILKKRPFVTLKLALSLDGKMSDSYGNSKWITGEAARKEVQKIRNTQDAIMVGIGTALADDPMLNVRLRQKKKDPVRVIIDRRARIQPDLKLIRSAKDIKTILAVSEQAQDFQIEELRKTGLLVIKFAFDERGIDLDGILSFLASQEITSLMVEGGAELASSFIEQGLVDKYILFYAPHIIGGFGSKSLLDKTARWLDNRVFLEIDEVKRKGEDLMVIAYPGRKRPKDRR